MSNFVQEIVNFDGKGSKLISSHVIIQVSLDHRSILWKQKSLLDMVNP